jgi:hypothetical protein
MCKVKIRPHVVVHTRREIMRHSDLRLTLDVYTDAGMLPLGRRGGQAADVSVAGGRTNRLT